MEAPPGDAFPPATHASTAAAAGRPFEINDDEGGATAAAAPPSPSSPTADMPDVPPPPVPPAGGADPVAAATAAATALMGGVTVSDGDAKSNGIGGKCEVIDPQHTGEGRSKYTTYCVLVPNLSAVRRRYNDFQWLYNRLHIEKPGSIIPIIPHKRVRLLKPETKFTTEFVSERRAILEEWINLILVHPELVDAPSLSAFMKQDDELFASAKKANDFDVAADSSLSLAEGKEEDDAAAAARDAAAEDDGATASNGTPGKQRFGRIRKLFAKAAIKSGVELAKVEDEETFADIDKYAKELEKDVAVLVKQSAILAKATKTSSDATHEIAKAFSGLSENTYPTPDLGAAGRLATMLNNAAKGMLSLASTLEEKSSAETDQIEAAIVDFDRDVQALRLALQRRTEKHYDLTKSLNRISTVGDKLDRMKEVAVNKTNEDAMVPIQVKEGEMLEAKDAAEAARTELEVVSARVIREVERFRLCCDGKLRHIIAEMGGVAVRFDDKINDSWGTILANTQPNVEPKFDAC
mmetsp:Transcript_37420/g.81914  ORF Transcript_37420/g.81914 Transcript_37420/m.81914 type:complete len:523 (-) Transcript_37420:1415-2983(-)